MKMKKLGMLVAFVLAMAVAMTSCSSSQSMTKEQKEAEKTVKKDARNLKKEGWKVGAGLPGIEMQLKQSYSMALEKDNNGYDKYVMGESKIVAETYDAALFHASNNAKLDLAGKMETEVAELIQTLLGNKQITQQEAASLTESAAASTNLVTQKLGRVIVPVRMYRNLPNGNVEVRTVMYYSHDMAMDVMKQSMREDLEQKANDLSKRLNNLLGF